MLFPTPWLIPLGIFVATVFSLGFIGWLVSRSRLADELAQILVAIFLAALFMAIGSLITLLVI